MQKSEPTPSLQNLVFLKPINDACIEKKKLKIRSFALFHKCQYNCLQDLKNKESEQCMQSCQLQLDKFQEFRKEKRPENKVFHAIPSDFKQIEEMNFTQDEFLLAKRKIADFRNKTDNYLENLRNYLNDWEKTLKK